MARGAARRRIVLVAAAFVVGAVVGLALDDREARETVPIPPPGVEPEELLPGAPPEVALDPPVTRARFEALRASQPPSLAPAHRDEDDGPPAPDPPLVAEREPPASRPSLPGPLRVEYTFAPRLTEAVFEVLRRARVELGHVILMDPHTGRVHVYASTDAERFPGTRTYPAASLIKVVTAAAALHYTPELAEEPCRFVGSPYRLTRARIHPPSRGKEVTLERALATSNNQCFAQLAVHGLGANRLLDTISRFGFLSEPAPGHAAGSAEAGDDFYDLGRLGCGLAGCRITPLHAVQLAATLAHGQLVHPWWVERVTEGYGLELGLPPRRPPVRVMTGDLARRLREMLVETTRSGTARRAFRTRRGPAPDGVRVAGKTGSLSGRNPTGRYEWFAGVAPAEDPTLAIAVVLVQGELWWRNASQVAAAVLETAFCTGGPCRPDGPAWWLGGDEGEGPPAGAASASASAR